MTAEDRKRDRSEAGRPDRFNECGLSFTVARSVDEVIEAWRLVHREYARTRLIHPNRHGIHTHGHAVHPGTAVIVGKIRSLIVSTMSVYVDRPQGLPLDSACHAAMQSLRRDGRRLVEMGLFADRREKIARSYPALLNLMRHAYYYSLHRGATDIVIGVHPRHAEFYRRLFGLVPFGEPTVCPHVNDRPMVPLRIDIHEQLANPKPPTGVAFITGKPIEPEVYAQRVRLDAPTLAGTTVERYLVEEVRAADCRTNPPPYLAPVPI